MLRGYRRKRGEIFSHMLKRYAFSFYEVVVGIERVRRTASIDSGEANTFRLDDLSTVLIQLRAECVKLDLAHTPDLISHVESEVHRKGKDYSCEDMANHLETLASTFATELRKELFFRIAEERRKYIEKDDLLGSQVNAAFPSCVTEITNAGNCYALEQNEACVFHLMRILERSLGVLASKFSVPFEHDKWHNIIEQLEAKIRKMDAGTFGPDWKDKQKFYARAANQFMFFKDAWRNHVMHVRDVFDEGKTRSVFNSVKGFMQALAEGGLAE
jgi:hypothetical protein